MEAKVTDGNPRGRFVWHELMTNDTAAASRFYQQVIGWTQQPWHDPSMNYSVWMAGERPVAGLLPLPEHAAAMGATPAWFTYIEVPSVDATLADAVALGGTIMVPARDIPDVGRFGMIQDPQGIPFAIITSATQPGEEADPQLLGVSWHELNTSDWKAGRSFYEALFGWERRAEHDMGPDGVYSMFGLGRFTLGGMFTVPPGTPLQWMNYFYVDSADAAAERATAAGGTIAYGPMDVPGGDRIAALVDPQGARFAVTSKPKVS